MDDPLDPIRRPGLAYQHAFDWLAVGLHAAGGPVACAVAAPWQMAEMAGRLPELPKAEAETDPLAAVGLVLPAAVDPALLGRLRPDGRLYAVVAGPLARFTADWQPNAPTLSERSFIAAARENGFAVVERIAIHPPRAIVQHYAGELALRAGSRVARDRRHFAMRRDMVTAGRPAALSALICLTLERRP